MPLRKSGKGGRQKLAFYRTLSHTPWRLHVSLNDITINREETIVHLPPGMRMSDAKPNQKYYIMRRLKDYIKERLQRLASNYKMLSIQLQEEVTGKVHNIRFKSRERFHWKP